MVLWKSKSILELEKLAKPSANLEKVVWSDRDAPIVCQSRVLTTHLYTLETWRVNRHNVKINFMKSDLGVS